MLLGLIMSLWTFFIMRSHLLRRILQLFFLGNFSCFFGHVFVFWMSSPNVKFLYFLCYSKVVSCFPFFVVPLLDRVRGAIVVSGKNLCLSVTQFLMACNSETVEEIDTKLVLPRLQHQQMCSALRIFLQGQLVGSFNYSFPVCHSNIF